MNEPNKPQSNIPAQSTMNDWNDFVRLAQTPTNRSRRSTKNKQSGRRGRTTHHGNQVLQAVGGYANALDAIAAPFRDEEGNLLPTCVVREPENTTWALGGSTEGQGYIGGRGV
jgi:hypothetical protein